MDWKNIQEKRPEVNQVVLCKGELWVRKKLSHTEELEIKYLGWNNVTGKPMVESDIINGYLNVTHWKPIIRPIGMITDEVCPTCRGYAYATNVQDYVYCRSCDKPFKRVR